LTDVIGAERRVLAVAGRQHGIVSSAQLAAAGLSVDAVRHRVRRGWLRRLHRGVYAVGPLQTPHSRTMAATLAMGARALASHEAAAALWDLLPPPRGPIDVTAVGREPRRRPGIRLHTTANLHPADMTRRHGIPTTSLPRTILDLAPRRVDHNLPAHALNEQFKRYPRHPGLKKLTEAHEPHFTRSEAERRLLALIRAARLPEPETNVRLHGYEVDFLWRTPRLVVEVDGYAYHSSRAAFERDRRRDAVLGARGHRVLRVTWRQLEHERAALVATLAVAIRYEEPPESSSSAHELMQ
jgi:very-short-patch-repair endonuclease